MLAHRRGLIGWGGGGYCMGKSLEVKGKSRVGGLEKNTTENRRLNRKNFRSMKSVVGLVVIDRGAGRWGAE